MSLVTSPEPLGRGSLGGLVGRGRWRRDEAGGGGGGGGMKQGGGGGGGGREKRGRGKGEERRV